MRTGKFTVSDAARRWLSSALLRVRRDLAVRRSEEGSARRGERDGRAHPIILLHGFLATCRTLKVLERRLRRDGHAPVVMALKGFGRARIEELAADLRAELEAFHATRPGAEPCTIIGHSQGGLVAAYYVKKLGGHRRVRALITLGTPHNGSLLAFAGLPFALLARSIPQMTPLSSLIRELREGDWPGGVHLTSIYSHEDRVALHPAALVEALDRQHVRNVRVAGNHRAFLYDRRIYDVILRELRACGTTAAALLEPATLSTRVVSS